MKLVHALQCTAKARTTGLRCGRPEVPGTGVCRYHGGNAKQVKAAGARRIAERDAQQQLENVLGRLDVKPVGDPLTALQQLAGEIVAWKDLLHDRVAVLKTVGYSGEYGEQINAEVTLFERALDRCASTLAAIARLNIDERLARVTEQQKLMVIRAIEAALASAGVAGPAAAEAKKVAARHLRAVPA